MRAARCSANPSPEATWTGLTLSRRSGARNGDYPAPVDAKAGVGSVGILLGSLDQAAPNARWPGLGEQDGPGLGSRAVWGRARCRTLCGEKGTSWRSGWGGSRRMGGQARSACVLVDVGGPMGPIAKPELGCLCDRRSDRSRLPAHPLRPPMCSRLLARVSRSTVAPRWSVRHGLGGPLH